MNSIDLSGIFQPDGKYLKKPPGFNVVGYHIHWSPIEEELSSSSGTFQWEVCRELRWYVMFWTKTLSWT